MKRRRRSVSFSTNSEDGHSSRSGSRLTSSSARTSGKRQKTLFAKKMNLNFMFALLGNVSTEFFDPSLSGKFVPPHTRRAGQYLLGPRYEHFNFKYQVSEVVQINFHPFQTRSLPCQEYSPVSSSERKD